MNLLVEFLLKENLSLSLAFYNVLILHMISHTVNIVMIIVASYIPVFSVLVTYPILVAKFKIQISCLLVNRRPCPLGLAAAHSFISNLFPFINVF